MSTPFATGQIWAFPTDTSWGLGVRADDAETLQALKVLKNRPDEKYFSLMVRDFAMLEAFAQIPEGMTAAWFFETPRTAILAPTDALPTSPFWPAEKVAFRIAPIPQVAAAIEYPVTATSANVSGQPPIFTTEELRHHFGDRIEIFPGFTTLDPKPPSEIWDFTVSPTSRLR